MLRSGISGNVPWTEAGDEGGEGDGEVAGSTSESEVVCKAEESGEGSDGGKSETTLVDETDCMMAERGMMGVVGRDDTDDGDRGRVLWAGWLAFTTHIMRPTA